MRTSSPERSAASCEVQSPQLAKAHFYPFDTVYFKVPNKPVSRMKLWLLGRPKPYLSTARAHIIVKLELGRRLNNTGSDTHRPG